MEEINKQSEINSNKSMIDRYNCIKFYNSLKICVTKSEDAECREEYKKLGECIIAGMKNEEKRII